MFIPKEKIENLFSTNNLIYIPKENFKSILIFSILFLCSILTVLNIIPYQIVLFLVLIITLIINKNLFTKADYTLLLTFVCFFIFTNNISNIESIKNFLVNLIHNKDFSANRRLSEHENARCEFLDYIDLSAGEIEQDNSLNKIFEKQVGLISKIAPGTAIL